MPVHQLQGFLTWLSPSQIAAGAFDLEDDDFEERFEFEKPGKEVQVIFTCAAGIRSMHVSLWPLRCPRRFSCAHACAVLSTPRRRRLPRRPATRTR